MAKKKAKESEPIYTQITKEYGENIIIGGLDLINEEKIIIPMSPSLDIMAWGGIEEGSWVGITGPEKSGKTTLALQIAANGQKPEYGGRKVYYLKVEGRLSRVHLRGMRDLNLEKPWFNVVQSQKGQILSAEQYLNIGSHILRTEPGSILIIDSISALCEHKLLTEGIGTSTRGGGAKVMSQFISTMNNVVPTNDCVVIGITQLMANTSGMGAQLQEKGSRIWKYQCDYQFRTTSKKHWLNTDNKVIGIEVDWKCNTSKLGPPGGTATSYVRFGIGIDKLYECIQYGSSIGLIDKSGAWYTLSYMEEHLEELGVSKWEDEGEKIVRAHGGEKLYNLLQANPTWADILQRKIVTFLNGDSTDEG